MRAKISRQTSCAENCQRIFFSFFCFHHFWGEWFSGFKTFGSTYSIVFIFYMKTKTIYINKNSYVCMKKYIPYITLYVIFSQIWMSLIGLSFHLCKSKQSKWLHTNIYISMYSIFNHIQRCICNILPQKLLSDLVSIL